MNIKKSIQVTLAASLLIMTSAVVAQALIPRTWVSSGGNDANACTRISPCGTFQGAHDKTSPGGQVNCVDAAEYGQVVINKSITINCDNTKASITATTSGISVAAGVSDIVTIRGIDIDGNGTGLQGINFSHGAALHVSKVHIRNFRSNNNFTAGILFQRNGNEYSELYVTDSDITDNGGSGPSSGGIVMFFQDTSTANMVLNGVRVNNNAVGILMDISAMTGTTGIGLNAVISDCVVSGNASHGIATATAAGKAAISLLVDSCKVTGNFGSGINVNGAAASGAGSAIARIGNSTICLNVMGVSTTGSGALQSFKNNQIAGNFIDGTPLNAVPGYAAGTGQ